MADRVTRREFANLVIAASVLSTGGVLLADDKTAEKPASKKEPPANPPLASPVDLLIDLVKHQYPHPNLNDAALDEIRSDLRHHLGRSKVLSSFPLVNADEPGFVFSAWRSDRAAG